MHEHDYEIIMALAEGTLDGSSAAAAAAEVSACAECSADLDMQRHAMSALAETADVYLTAKESADLHSRLHRELSLVAPAARPRRFPAWAKWVPVAGVAAVFLAAVAFFPGMGGNSDDASDETMAAAATETTEAGLFEMTDAPAAEALPDRSEQNMLGDDATEAPATTEAPMATTTTAAASGTTMSDLTSVMDGLEYLGEIGELDTAALRDQIAADYIPLSYASDNAKQLDPVFADCALEKATPELADSLGVPVNSEPLLLGIVSDANGEEFVLVAYVPEDVTETVFVTLRLFNCELVELLP